MLCGLVHDGFIFIGGWNGITVVSEQNLTVVKKLFSGFNQFICFHILSKGKDVIAVGDGHEGEIR